MKNLIKSNESWMFALTQYQLKKIDEEKGIDPIVKLHIETYEIIIQNLLNHE